MTQNKPTVLLLHGAWHTPAHYAPVASQLESLGYQVLVPRHPTCNDAEPPNKTMQDDIDNVRNIVERLVAENKAVIVLMHSYGGMIGTGALGGLAAGRSGRRETVGVVALIYMTAFVPFENESLAGIFGGTLPPFLTPDAKSGCVLVDNPQHFFYNDLPVEEQERWVKELVRHPTAAQFTPIGDQPAAWREMSGKIWYLLCEGDQGLPLFQQEMMVKRLTKQGLVVNVERCKAGHSPFLSMPGTVCEVVNKVAGLASI